MNWPWNPLTAILIIVLIYVVARPTRSRAVLSALLITYTIVLALLLIVGVRF